MARHALRTDPARRTLPSRPRLAPRREHRWSEPQRVTLIAVVAIVMGSLFLTSYSLALGDPIPRRIVMGPLLDRLDLPVLGTWGILALQLLTVGCFTSLMIVLIGPWAIVPTWLFFTVLGNSSSGGAVAPPLLPRPFAFVSQWLPSGATVTALRDAVYFPDHQHVQPIAVLATWAAVLFAVMLVVSHRLGRSPGQ